MPIIKTRKWKNKKQPRKQAGSQTDIKYSEERIPQTNGIYHVCKEF